jgi:hypothetical protein
MASYYSHMGCHVVEWSVTILKGLRTIPHSWTMGRFQAFHSGISMASKTSHPSRGGTCDNVEIDAPHTDGTVSAPPKFDALDTLSSNQL